MGRQRSANTPGERAGLSDCIGAMLSGSPQSHRHYAYFIGKFFLQVQATVPQVWDSPRGFKFKGRKRQLITHSLSGKPGRMSP